MVIARPKSSHQTEYLALAKNLKFALFLWKPPPWTFLNYSKDYSTLQPHTIHKMYNEWYIGGQILSNY